jgi:hypothetical protein
VIADLEDGLPCREGGGLARTEKGIGIVGPKPREESLYSEGGRSVVPFGHLSLLGKRRKSTQVRAELGHHRQRTLYGDEEDHSTSRRGARPARPPDEKDRRRQRPRSGVGGSRSLRKEPRIWRRPNAATVAADPALIPHDDEKRGVATQTNLEPKQQVGACFRPGPLVTGSARLTLSR